MDNTIYTSKYNSAAFRKGGLYLPESQWEIATHHASVDLARGSPSIEDVITLALVDGDFLPVISKLSLKEATQLRDALDKIIAAKSQGKSLTIAVPPED